MMYAKRTIVGALALAPLAGVSTAHAQAVAKGFNVNQFEPSERGNDWFGNESMDIRGDFRPAVGAIGDYSYKSLVSYNPDGTVKEPIIRDMMIVHLGASLTFADRFRFALNLPVMAYSGGHAGGTLGPLAYLPPKDEQGVGDLRLALDARIVGTPGDAAVLGLGIQAWLPTGNRENYMSDEDLRLHPRAVVAGDLGAFTYSVQGGVNVRGRNDAIGDSQLGNALAVSAAAGLRLNDRKLVIGPELWASTVFDDAFAKRATPVEAIFGAHYWIAKAVRLGAGAGGGIYKGYGTPSVRVLFGLEIVPDVSPADADGDGIVDPEDACPGVAGVRSDDPAKNGCPAVSDRDGDGVSDGEDACPDAAGVRTGDAATNGCPPDADKDGVTDKDDACPNVAGVRSDDPAKNGCPGDTDGDGIADNEDACPDKPGIRTDDKATHGCPDPDRDRDGVANDSDACPDEPGKADPDPKRNGCPKAFVKAGMIQIQDQVKFKTASAVIVAGKESEEILFAVLKILTDHPEIAVVRVEGHTDNKGAAAFNKKLSADRAASVVTWLTKHGMDKNRLTSAGFGSDTPLADNTTEEGRKQNRRVEFHIDNPAQK